MRTVPVSAERDYQVEIGVDWRVALSDWVEGRNKVVVITSENLEVETAYPTIRVPDGESGKSPEVLLSIWQKLGELGLNREDLIIGIGGGTVTDLAGFAAASWLRGIDWLAIPTTIAGMVDAAVGGKTGINSNHGKNLIGAFHSPVGVLIDLQWIETLSERDVAAGMAEVVKCGFIADSQILQLLEHKSLKDVCNDVELQLELIHCAVSVKAYVVGEDFKESYLREILNYGHTLGHAIEVNERYQWRHGAAISVGMMFVAELGRLAGRLPDAAVDRHRSILTALGLPVSYPASEFEKLLAAMQRDKKSRGGALRFVVLDDVAKPTIMTAPTKEMLFAAYQEIAG